VVPVIVESPFAADDAVLAEQYVFYLRACLHDCLTHGMAPFASHGLYTLPGVLDDKKPEERRLGIEAGFAWRAVATKTVVYTDFGVSSGMAKGIRHAIETNPTHEVEYRTLPPYELECVKARTCPRSS
jgi:hypothetical protein